MVNVDIDKELYDDIKKAVQRKKYLYPSIKFFVQKAIYNELLNSKEYSDLSFEEFYSHLKEILKYEPKLKSKVDELHSKEFKKLRRVL